MRLYTNKAGKEQHTEQGSECISRSQHTTHIKEYTSTGAQEEQERYTITRSKRSILNVLRN